MSETEFELLGVRFEQLSFEETVCRIVRLVDSPEPCYVATANLDFYSSIYGFLGRVKNRPLLEALQAADLVTPDGMPIVWLSRLLGHPLRERVAGADLVPAVMKRAGEEGRTVFLLGGAPGVADRAGRMLEETCPGLGVVGLASPKISADRELDTTDRLLIEQINEVEPDILLIALGGPKQELWFRKVRDHLRVGVAMGIGGTLSMMVGEVRRAPLWMQRWGLEWFYRLTREPRRLWRRYLVDTAKFCTLGSAVLIAHFRRKMR